MRVLVLTCFIVVCYTATITQQLCKVPLEVYQNTATDVVLRLGSSIVTNGLITHRDENIE